MRPFRHIAFFFALVLLAEGAQLWAQRVALPAQRAGEQVRAFRIPADDAARTLAQFSEQAGTPLVYVVDHVRGIRTAAIDATLAPQAALERMLADTPLLVLADARTGTLMLKLRDPAAAPETPTNSNPFTSDIMISAPPASDAAPRSPSATDSGVSRKKATGLFNRLAVFFALSAGAPAVAQDAGTASIRGTVRNAATAANLNQASVRITNQPNEILTERDGTYTVPGLRPGTYDLTVSFVGLDSQTKSVTVGASETAVRDFELSSSLYKMDAFVVAGEVEGNAAEINKAKKSDIFINAISADMLGTIPGGNVGEFLKYVPGLLVDYGAFPEAETVSMRGQDADATQFTFDGMPQASAGRVPRAADESTTGMNFNDMTIDNIEAIEVYKAPPAWMSPSTGGVINAVRKNAFAQKGRRLTLVGTLNGNSQWLTLKPIRGHGGERTYPIQPGLRLNYSEAFLNNTLGVALTYGQTGKLDPRHNYIQTYARVDGKTGAALAADPTTDDTPLRYGTFGLVNTWDPLESTCRHASLSIL